MQKARFEDGFIFQNKLDDAVSDTLIPPFTLELLVENCLKHNIVSLNRPLQIRIFMEGESIVVENQVQQFFRMNRQYLVNFPAIKEIEYYFMRKLYVKLVIETPDQLLINQEKVPTFLAWMENR